MVERRRRVALKECRGQIVTLALKHDLAELNIKKSTLKEEGIRETNPRVHLGVVLKALKRFQEGKLEEYDTVVCASPDACAPDSAKKCSTEEVHGMDDGGLFDAYFQSS